MTTNTPIPYPGHLIQKGEGDAKLVKNIQNQLNRLGCGPIDVDGEFGNQTLNAVKLFQARYTDTSERPLLVDGKLGAITWAALFGQEETPQAKTFGFLQSALQIAQSQIGIMEQPMGSNRGPEIDQFLRSTGKNPATGSYAWCAAFVYWCFNEAAKKALMDNPVIRTAGVMDHWNKAGQRQIPRLLMNDAFNDPGKIKPGFLFVISSGGGLGHIGIVEQINAGLLTTIEGNTNNNGSREGIGVFRRESRKVSQINRGFIDYSGFKHSSLV